MSVRVVIAEDEALAREKLRGWLDAEAGVEVVGIASDGAETLSMIRSSRPDVVFLDVRMPELDGFGVVRALEPTELPVIVFVTAHQEFALQAFDVHAADYLLKPFTRARFRKALERARALARNGAQPPSLAELVASASLLAAGKPIDRIAVRSESRILFIKPEEIDWVESADNYTEAHVGKSVHLLRRTLVALQEQLPASTFVRISRSVIVNADRVREIRPRTHGDYIVVLVDGVELPGSRNFRAPLFRIMGKL